MSNVVKKFRKKQAKREAEWYSLRSILGYSWALFLMLLGGREAGKSYAVTEFFCRQWRLYGRPFYWLRLTDTSQTKLLNNNAFVCETNVVATQLYIFCCFLIFYIIFKL